MHIPGDTIHDRLTSKGITRREFLKFCTFMAGALALPPSAGEDIARALSKAKRTPVVWLELQDCAGCSEAFLRASSPSAAEVILDLLSVDYQETIMAASGYLAEEAKDATIKAGGYILIVEGSISPADDGVYCCIGGKSSVQLLKEAAANAVAVIALGNCATFGGLPKANPNPTKAVGVMDIISDKPVLNLPGCPVNVVNLTATVVHYLTFNKLPEMDKLHRPLFGFGHLIHDNCERRGHFDAGQFVKKWGDEGHRQGWCLYQMGCKGPISSHNCPSVRYNEGVSWPVGSGHGCIGCSEPGFWDWPTYQPVQVSAFTPPTTYPRIKEETQAITPGGAAISGGTVGAIIGAAAAFWYMSVTRRLSTKKESGGLEPEELPETPKEESEP
ncbi:MAG TPA: hydrogenase small subunit [Anaerolineaceae bacterium]